MKRILRFTKLMFRDILTFVCTLLFFYGCLHIPQFANAYPDVTLIILLTTMGLCVVFGTITGLHHWITTQWKNSKEKEEKNGKF